MKHVVLLSLVMTVVIQILSTIAYADVPYMINFQGHLTDSTGTPLNGLYDFNFRIYDDSISGSELWQETHNSVSVTNGSFHVILGDGSTPVLINDTVFNQSNRWLGITIGTDPELTPRTRLVSVGYSYRVSTVDGAMGGIISGDVSIQSDLTIEGKVGIGTNNPSTKLEVDGTVTATTYHGDGSNLTGIASGCNWTVTDSVLYTSNYWGIARGDAGNLFYGDSAYTSVNFGVSCTTGVLDEEHSYMTIGGGRDNKCIGTGSVVAGGESNTAGLGHSTIGGGRSNVAMGGWSTVSGGFQNNASGDGSTICGGTGNVTGYRSTVGGGTGNSASDQYCTVSGGTSNGASNHAATVGGGESNAASGTHSTVGGGGVNTASGPEATVGGGASNTAYGARSTVGGGYDNYANNWYCTIGGGDSDSASGYCSTVPGGKQNCARGNYSFAAGYRAKANHDNTFVWADSIDDADFVSTGPNQFLIRADGGVGIGTNGPESELHVNGAVRLGTAANEYEIKEVLATDPDPWASFLTSNGIRIGNDAGGNRQMFMFTDGGGDANIFTVASSSNSGINWYERFVVDQNGNVGIGIGNPAYALDVNGDINCSGSYNIKKGGVNYTHPDYVFEPGYKLMSLNKLREYVYEHKHLPNVISADEVKANDGFKLDELLIQMLEKIEEQTLYILQLEREKASAQALNDELAEIKELKAENANIKAQLSQLTALVETVLAQQRDANDGSDRMTNNR